VWLLCTHNRKGISRSAKPYRRSAPSWLKATAPSVIDQISKMAKKGMTPSQIGVMLRDSHGIAQVKAVTGSKILRILKSQGACLNPKSFRNYCIAPPCAQPQSQCYEGEAHDGGEATRRERV